MICIFIVAWADSLEDVTNLLYTARENLRRIATTYIELIIFLQKSNKRD